MRIFATKGAGVSVTGTKDELIDRIAKHFASNSDVRTVEPPPPPPPPEPRVLAPAVFDDLFGSLRGEDLTDMLTGIESPRVTGTKEQKVNLLKESRFSEMSLFLQLDAKQLDAILVKRRLKLGGSKRDRVDRIVVDAVDAFERQARTGVFDRVSDEVDMNEP